jgi:hypothetical protein
VRRSAEEKKLIEELRQDLERWRLARDLRAYVSEMRGVVAAASMKPTEGGPLHRYLTFVLDYADRMDPLRELRDEIANAAQPS